jgi:hypothetical protein
MNALRRVLARLHAAFGAPRSTPAPAPPAPLPRDPYASLFEQLRIESERVVREEIARWGA